MWYVMLMRNSNSIMSINVLWLYSICLLLNSKIRMLGDSGVHYLHRRLRCFHTGDSGSPRNFQTLWKLASTTLSWNFWWLTLWGSIMLCAYYKHRVDIENYLAPMWHVCSNKFQFALMLSFLFWILFVEDFLGKVFLKCGLLHLSWKTIWFKLF